MTPALLLASACAGIAAASLGAALYPPPPSLRRRLRPYVQGSRARLGTGVEPSALVVPPWPGSVQVIETVRSWLRGAGELRLRRRLRSCGMWAALGDADRVRRYRLGLVGSAAGGGAAGVGVAVAAGALAAGSWVLAGVGAIGAVSLWRGRIDRAIRRRRRRMRLELATVCQLLAVWVRAGGGVVAAATRLVERGRGEVVTEIAEALRLHHSGLAASTAFRRLAEVTPEPHARRCYRTLAGAEERGTDVAAGLLALASAVRADMRETVRREATRRRAVMLVPIVGVLGPVLVLFVAAPLPWIVLRSIGRLP